MPTTYPVLPNTPGNLQGAPSTSGIGPYGQLPQVPNPSSTQASAISGNMGNLSSLYSLGYGLNSNIATQSALPYQLNLPNYGAMTGQSSSNILSLLQGQVPQDVANQIAQMGAERGVSTGSIGSPNSEAALLRSLGLTSLGLQSQGEQELSGAIARTPTGQQFNLASFLTTPEQQQQAQYAANLMSAAPDPTAAANTALARSLFGMQYGRQQASQGSPMSPMPISAPAAPSLPSYNSLAPMPVTDQSNWYDPNGDLLGWNLPSTPVQSSTTGFQPGDFESMGFFDDQSAGGSGVPADWQTGMPLDNYSPPDYFSGDMFG